jgi:anti-anti-sigma regulatory factor
MRNEGVAQGKTVCLVNVGPPTHRLLEITGLHDAFDIRPTQA